jgi:SAM-dependent methyltransferase
MSTATVTTAATDSPSPEARQPGYWEERYQAGETNWEKGAPSPGLADFLADQPDLVRGRVVVPGCGTGHDVRAWARAGFAATGLDFAPSAIRLAVERTRATGLRAEFCECDFLHTPVTEPFDWLFEHTLFCALPPAARDDYTRAVERWVRPHGQFLAVHYLVCEPDGPPWPVTREEVLIRFQLGFDLIADWLPRSYPNRVGKEWMFWWRRKAA